MTLEKYIPERTLSAVQRVREVHRTAAESSVESEADLLGAVRRLLESCSWEDLPELSRRMRIRDLRAVCHFTEDEAIGEKARRTLELRPRPDLLQYALGLLMGRYPAEGLERCVRGLARRTPAEDTVVVGRATAPRVRRWLRESLAEGLAADWVSAFAEDDHMPTLWLQSNYDIRGGPGLSRAVLLEGLLKRSPAFTEVVRHSEPRLFEELTATDRERLGWHYLQDTESLKEMSEELIDVMVDWHGQPQAGEHQSSFWQRIPTDVRDAIRRHLMLRNLGDFLTKFHDTHGRYEFWRPYIECHARNVELNCKDRESDRWRAICIEFDRVGVVEFGHVGNASYVYDIDKFRAITGRRVFNENDLKSQDQTTRRGNGGPIGDGRIQHHEGWQRRYRHWVNQLVGRPGP